MSKVACLYCLYKLHLFLISIAEPLHIHPDLFEFGGILHTWVISADDHTCLAERTETRTFEFVEEMIEMIIFIVFFCDELIRNQQLNFADKRRFIELTVYQEIVHRGV